MKLLALLVSLQAFAGNPGFLVCTKGRCTGLIADSFRKYAGDRSCFRGTGFTQSDLEAECESADARLDLDRAEETYFYANCGKSCAVTHFLDRIPPLPPVEYPAFTPGKAAGPLLCSTDSQCGLGHCVDSRCDN